MRRTVGATLSLPLVFTVPPFTRRFIYEVLQEIC